MCALDPLDPALVHEHELESEKVKVRSEKVRTKWSVLEKHKYHKIQWLSRQLPECGFDKCMMSQRFQLMQPQAIDIFGD